MRKRKLAFIGQNVANGFLYFGSQSAEFLMEHASYGHEDHWYHVCFNLPVLMFKNSIQQCLKRYDVQTCAMLACLLTRTQCPLSSKHLYQHVRQFYADILHRWNLNCQRSELLKFNPALSTEQQFEQSKQFVSHIRLKPERQRSWVSGPPECSICHLPVKGMSVLCIKCGHGGHVNHLHGWFSKQFVCPAGCGCRCIDYLPLWNQPLLKAEDEGLSFNSLHSSSMHNLLKRENTTDDPIFGTSPRVATNVMNRSTSIPDPRKSTNTTTSSQQTPKIHTRTQSSIAGIPPSTTTTYSSTPGQKEQAGSIFSLFF